MPDVDVQRTDLHCHACEKNFVAELEIGIDGKHCIECPWCGHNHYRVVEGGRITEARWGHDSSSDTKLISPRSVWKSTVIQARTSSVSAFIRERWLNRSDFNGHG